MKKKILLTFYIWLLYLPLFFAQNTISIPDPNFEQALIDQEIDSDGLINGSVADEDIKSITSLNVSDKGIKDLTGIEGFKALEVLKCSNNLLDNIDINSITTLKELNFSSNRLTFLDVSNLTTLENLNCANNRLSSLDVGSNTGLKYLLPCY